MGIDIFNLQPTKVSRNLSGKIVMFYGEPKVGKTTNAVKFPKPLLLAAEKGYNALSGVMAQPIQKWSDFSTVLKQLKKPQAHEMFQTIIIDTADILYELAEKYVISQFNETHFGKPDFKEAHDIGDIPYGGGYSKVKKVFDEGLRSIPLLGYGLVIISHAETKTFKDENGKEFQKIVPTVPKRAREIVTGMSDIIAYARNIDTAEGTQSKLFLRGTQRYEAGSRFKYMVESIPFDYTALVNAIADAVEQEGATTGLVTDKGENVYEDSNKVDFNEVHKKATELAGKIYELENHKYAKRIAKVVSEQLGENKLKDVTEDQAELVSIVADNLEALYDEVK